MVKEAVLKKFIETKSNLGKEKVKLFNLLILILHIDSI